MSDKYFYSLSETEILNLIDKWHNSNTDQKLHDFLGLTLEEYERWVIGRKTPSKKRLSDLAKIYKPPSFWYENDEYF